MIQKRAVHEGRQKLKLRHAPQPLNVFIAQEVYRVLLFAIFLAQVAVVRHVPYIGENCCSTWSTKGLFNLLYAVNYTKLLKANFVSIKAVNVLKHQPICTLVLTVSH